MSAPQRYPLAWPPGRPRKSSSQRKTGRFKRHDRWITIPAALDRLETELKRIGAVYPLLSTNVELTMRGEPKAGQSPADPGAVAYFTLRGEQFALACDTYHHVEDNIAALAAHLEATRAIERHGVASAAESLQAFAMLPPPAPKATPWWVILELPEDILKPLKPEVARTVVDGAYRALAAKAHPDAGGSSEAMAELNRAREEALASIAPVAVRP